MIKNLYDNLRGSGISKVGAILIILISPFTWLYSKVFPMDKE